MTPSVEQVSVGEAAVTALRYTPDDGEPRARLILAHGAGADQRHRTMVALAERVAREGVEVVTFNFLYTEARRKTPDRPAVLEQTWRAVVEHLAGTPDGRRRLVIGGKSMGGRIASMVLSQPPASDAWARVSGLVLLGYPLHPPGKPEQLRTAHLPAIRVPVLLVQGTRDPFGTRDEVEPIFRSLPTRVDFELVEQGDHGFAVPKATGFTASDIADRIAKRVAGWILG